MLAQALHVFANSLAAEGNSISLTAFAGVATKKGRWDERIIGLVG
jgi:hypothetical protein